MVTELTLTLVLLAGAGFMMRSFVNMYRIDVGVDTSRLLTTSMVLPGRKYPTRQSAAALLRRIDERLDANGTFAAASTTTGVPLAGGAVRQLVVDGRSAGAGDTPANVTLVSAGPRYFDALDVRLVRGRAFELNDGGPGHEVAIINERTAALYFGTAEPIGTRVRLTDDTPAGRAAPWATIVGIVPNIRQRSFGDPNPDPVVYIPHVQSPVVGLGAFGGLVRVVARGRSDPGQLAKLVRSEISAIDPDIVLADIRTLDQDLAQQRWLARVFTTMFSVFAGIAIVLAAIGLFAVTAYSVTQRTQEIGLRMALGARTGQVAWLILRRGLLQLVIGLTLGVAGAFGVGRLLKSLLFQTGPTDPVTLISVTVLLMIVGISASLWPAWQATRLDPVTALRYE
jgi:predicted permease